MQGISSWSIRNPVPIIVLFVSLVFMGWQAYGKLRINSMPDIEFPAVTVSVSQRGASPTEIETQITNLVEDALEAVSDVESIESVITEGSSVTTVEFALGKDLREAIDDIESQISALSQSLPQSADDPVVAKINSGDTSVLAFAVNAPGLKLDEQSRLVDEKIATAILKVDGVSKVKRLGGATRSVLLELDWKSLKAYGLSVSSITSQLAARNLTSPAGRIDSLTNEQSVRLVSKVENLSELETLPLTTASGSVVRLGTVARIIDGWEEPRQLAMLDGENVVAFEVFAAKGASQVKVAEEVRALVLDLNEGKIGNAKIREVSSSSDFVVESFHAAFEALWIGALLSVLVVWMFLRDWRATLVASTALPLSLIPTFAIMHWLNLSLNGITLLALSLVVGILVDDAIVEIENIVRHMRKSGKSAFQSAIEAADEIGLAVVATTLTIVAVFLPVSFMPGIPGAFFFSFAVVTCVSVLFSLLVARTVTPLLAAYFVKAGGHEEKQGFVTKSYIAFLELCLRRRTLTFTAGIVFFIASCSLALFLKQEFMVATDRGRTTITVSLQPGSTLKQTKDAATEVYHRIEQLPEVDSVFVAIGGGVSSGGGPQARDTRSDVTTATMTVDLVPRDERDISQQQFEAAISSKVISVPGARVRVGSGNSGERFSITLLSADGKMLTETAAHLVSQMRTVKGLSSPTSSESATKPEITIIPNQAKLAQMNINAADLASVVNLATLGPQSHELSKVSVDGRELDIVPTLPRNEKSDPDFLDAMPVQSGQGFTTLGALAEIKLGAGPSTIRHVNGERSITISADLRGLTSGEASSLVADLPVMKSLNESISVADRGDQKRMRELFSGFINAFITGVLLMYLTLFLLFRSFMQPLTILTALPLSIGGALGLLFLSGSSLSLTALIGILLLMGIAAKNSILLVEYAIVAQDRGVERKEALLESASKRARPIVMTSIAMGMGMLPIALGIGADAESRVPMGLAVIGGLLSSTVLSLVYVPVVYTFVDDFEKWCVRRFGRLIEKS